MKFMQYIENNYEMKYVRGIWRLKLNWFEDRNYNN
jgi:hypothetical protein